MRPKRKKRKKKKRFIAGPCKETGGLCSKNTKLLTALLKARWERGAWLIAMNFLLSESFRILCSCDCPSGHTVPINLQQGKGSATLYLHMNRLLKVRALTPASIRQPVYFRLYATFFYKRCRTSKTKHRQQNRSNTESDLSFPLTASLRKSTIKVPRDHSLSATEKLKNREEDDRVDLVHETTNTY